MDVINYILSEDNKMQEMLIMVRYQLYEKYPRPPQEADIMKAKMNAKREEIEKAFESYYGGGNRRGQMQ